MKKLLLILLPLTLLSIQNSAIAENKTRCACFFDGYDEYKDKGESAQYCDNTVPGSTADDCDLVGMKDEWYSGCRTAADNKARECNLY